MVFEGRNKAYGAYRIRKSIGRRYRLSLICVVCIALLFGVVPVAFSLYGRYRMAQALQEAGKQLEAMSRREKSLPYEVKRIAAGRPAPRQTTIKEATEQAPDIVETTEQDLVIGIKGDSTVIVEEHATFEDRDTLHEIDRADLPEEGPQLTATDIVREMPQFPGGIKALMAWLDANIPYPQSCRDAKVEGEMQLRFFVDATGHVVQPEVTQTLHPDLDRAALLALSKMPQWTPGTEGGRPATICIIVPLSFHLR